MEGRPAALSLCAPTVTLPEHFGEGLTHGRQHGEEKVENAKLPAPRPCVQSFVSLFNSSLFS